MVCKQNFYRLTVLTFLLLFMIVNTCLAAPSPARHALVIGNGDYKAGPLKNPVNDSRDIRVLLQELGFKVTHLENAGKRPMEDAIRAFGKALRQSGGLGLFYYAGHGMQVAGKNYLIPVGTRIMAEHEVEYEAVYADRILSEMSEAGNPVNIVILDACRNNPFARSFRSSAQGLAQVNRAPTGTLIAYATDPGNTALDGKGRNSPYTRALLKYLKTPGSSITKAFQAVRKDVLRFSSGKQRPWETTSLTDEVILVAGGSAFYTTDAPAISPQTGSLVVATRPSGAALSVAGTFRGRTPLTLENLDPGQLQVKVQLSGYESAVKKVLIRAGRESHLTLFLDKIVTTGTLKISSDPAGAEWYLDGAYVGLTPDTLFEVEKGSHKILVKKSGYHEWSKTTTIFSKQEALVAAGLKKLPVKKYQASENRPAKTATGTPSSGDIFIDSVTGIEFIWVPGGCFEMGSNSGDSDEKPVHKVCVDGFYIGKYEVTQGQWRKFMGNNPAHFKKGDNYPVEQVSWDDCQSFVRKLNGQSNKTYRLPTEAEWGYACRSGGRDEKYSGGNDVDRVAWYLSNSGGSTHAVGGKAVNGLGLYDMSGNVWEWCSDWYDKNYYNKSPEQNPQGPGSGWFLYRVERGGCWCDYPQFVRTANRSRFRPSFRSYDLGFRLVSPGRR